MIRLFALDFTNPWVTSFDGSRWRIPSWLILPIAVGAVGGSIAMAHRLPIETVENGWVGFARARAILYFAVFAPMLVVVGGFAAVERRAPRQGAGVLSTTALGLTTGGASFGLTLAILAAAGVLRPGPPSFLSVAALSVSAVLILLQSLSEEIFFRGWLQPVLASRWGLWVGLLATSILFSVAHSLTHPFGPIGVLGNILAGVLFGSLALRTGGITAPVAAHFLWNLLETAVLGLTPNPGVDELGSLMNWELVGPPLWTGGADELNGSLATVFALTIVSAAFLGTGIRRDAGGRSAAVPAKKTSKPLQKEACRIRFGRSAG